METYNQTQLRNILKDEISSRRLHLWLPLLWGIVAALPAIAFTLKSHSVKMLVIEFIVIVLGVGTFFWNIHYERKYKEDNKKIQNRLQQIANDE